MQEKKVRLPSSVVLFKAKKNQMAWFSIEGNKMYVKISRTMVHTERAVTKVTHMTKVSNIT